MRVDDELPQEDLHGKVTAKLRTREFLCALEHRQLLAAESVGHYRLGSLQ